MLLIQDQRQRITSASIIQAFIRGTLERIAVVSHYILITDYESIL